MKRNITINKETILEEAIGTRTHHSCKPVINRTTGEMYASATDAAEALGVSVYTVSGCCTGKAKTCKGNKLEYVDHVSGNVNSLTAEIRILKAKLAEMEEDAAVGRAIREEKEAIRKAEEKRLNDIEETKQALIKADEKIARRTRIVENAEAQYQLAVSRLMKAENEKKELTMQLLKLEGKLTEDETDKED